MKSIDCKNILTHTYKMAERSTQKQRLKGFPDMYTGQKKKQINK